MDKLRNQGIPLPIEKFNSTESSDFNKDTGTAGFPKIPKSSEGVSRTKKVILMRKEFVDHNGMLVMPNDKVRPKR
jgi:hypothetical protein